MKIVKYIFVISLIAYGLVGCKYDFVVPIEIPPTNDSTAVQISFANDIQPIFNSKCIFCHKTGGQVPNLTEGNSYAALTAGTEYVNTANPSESMLVKQPAPDNGTSHQKYSAQEAVNVLIWIQQGAKNN